MAMVRGPADDNLNGDTSTGDTWIAEISAVRTINAEFGVSRAGFGWD